MSLPADVLAHGASLLQRYTPSMQLSRAEAQQLMRGDAVRNGALKLYGAQSLTREAVVELADWLDWWEVRHLPPQHWQLLNDTVEAQPPLPDVAAEQWAAARDDGDSDVHRALLLSVQRRLVEMSTQRPMFLLGNRVLPVQQSDLLQRARDPRGALDTLLLLYPVFALSWWAARPDYPWASCAAQLERDSVGPMQMDVQLVAQLVPYDAEDPGMDLGVVERLRVHNAESWMARAGGPKAFDVLSCSVSGNLTQFRVELTRTGAQVRKLAEPTYDVDSWEQALAPVVLLDAEPVPEVTAEEGDDDYDAQVAERDRFTVEQLQRGFVLRARCNEQLRRHARGVLRVVHDDWVSVDQIDLEQPHPWLQQALQHAHGVYHRVPTWLGPRSYVRWPSELATQQIVSMRLAVEFDLDSGTFSLRLRRESNAQLTDVSQLLALTPTAAPMTLMMYANEQAPSPFWAPLFYQSGGNSLYPRAELRTAPLNTMERILLRDHSLDVVGRTGEAPPASERQRRFRPAVDTVSDGAQRPSSLLADAPYVYPTQHPQHDRQASANTRYWRPVWFGLWLSELHPDPDVMSERCERLLTVCDPDRLLLQNRTMQLRVSVQPWWRRQGVLYRSQRNWDAQFALLHRMDATVAVPVRETYGSAAAYHWRPAEALTPPGGERSEWQSAAGAEMQQ